MLKTCGEKFWLPLEKELRAQIRPLFPPAPPAGRSRKPAARPASPAEGAPAPDPQHLAELRKEEFDENFLIQHWIEVAMWPELARLEAQHQQLEVFKLAFRQEIHEVADGIRSFLDRLKRRRAK